MLDACLRHSAGAMLSVDAACVLVPCKRNGRRVRAAPAGMTGKAFFSISDRGIATM